MVHICPYCKQPFEGRRNKRFCNRSHAEMYNRHDRGKREQAKPEPNMTGQCLQCGAPVPQGQRYCCDICGKRWRYATKYAAPDYQKKERKMKQPPLIPAHRPFAGPRCECCGVVLYPYERTKCLKCARTSIIAAREEVRSAPATMAVARAQAGD